MASPIPAPPSLPQIPTVMRNRLDGRGGRIRGAKREKRETASASQRIVGRSFAGADPHTANAPGPSCLHVMKKGRGMRLDPDVLPVWKDLSGSTRRRRRRDRCRRGSAGAVPAPMIAPLAPPMAAPARAPPARPVAAPPMAAPAKAPRPAPPSARSCGVLQAPRERARAPARVAAMSFFMVPRLPCAFSGPAYRRGDLAQRSLAIPFVECT